MEKAYDPKALLEALKAQGLPVLEDAAEKTIEAVFTWLQESAVKSENRIDDALMVLYPHAKELALGQADKIDGSIEKEEV